MTIERRSSKSSERIITIDCPYCNQDLGKSRKDGGGGSVLPAHIRRHCPVVKKMRDDNELN